METSAVFEMFETIKNKLDKQTEKPVEPVQVDMTPVNNLTERLEDVIEEVKKPAIVEHQHRHTIDIQSNWFFFSWILLAVIIFALFWTLANQRQAINAYRENDLKYRYIKMQGETSEENIYRLEQQFRYSDSIKIIRKQVEKFEELVKEQSERIERANRANREAERLQKEMELSKNSQHSVN
jgi:hypothetical protein